MHIGDLNIDFLSSGHDVKDDLIFYRYALTLKAYGCRIKIFAKSDNPFEVLEGIQCYGVIKSNWKRIFRFTLGDIKLLSFALINKADIYIICTPDLLLTGFILKYFFRRKVIYNAQENYKVKFLDRDWIPKLLVKLLSKVESYLGNLMDGIIVTDSISYKNYEIEKIIILPNFPQIDDILSENEIIHYWERKVKNEVLNIVYIGGISKNRGLDIFIKLSEILPDNILIHLWGKFSNDKEEEKISQNKRIVYHGFIEHKEIYKELLNYDIGLCLFENTPAYYYYAENTTKLFEYMKAGIPIIVSNFPGLRKIIEDSQCGFPVDPYDIHGISNLLLEISTNKKVLEKLGINGYHAILERFNWNIYRSKLLDFILMIANPKCEKNIKNEN